MRLVSALLFVALTGSVALADEAKPADPKLEVARSKVPLRVVRMLPETRQVLLLDKNRGTHVVAEVGQEVDGYIVDEIADDEVTLVAPSGAEVILTAPDMTWRRRAAERKAATAKHAAATTAATNAAPGLDAPSGATHAAPGPDAASDATHAALAPAQTGEPAPADPYADPEPALSTEPAGTVRSASATAAPASVTATSAAASASANGTGAAPAAAGTSPAVQPADPYANLDPGIAAFVEAVGATPAPAAQPPATQPAPVLPAGPAPAPQPPAGAPAPAAPANSITVARADVDAALSDFGATAVTFDARFVADGLRIDAIASGTILAKAGLHKGDTITAIDGKPLRSFDDAADLYARLGTARAATIAIVRAGKPMTLRVTIR